MAMFVLEHAGTRPPVVCLHGFCQSSAYWAPTLDRVAARGVQALAPDLPGFAASASEPGPYTMSDLADAVVRMLDARRIDRVRLVGGSMGGVVAQQLVLRHPARVERLLLVATGAVMGDPAAGRAKADAMAAAPWDDAAAVPIVDGFFHRRPDEGEIRRLRAIARSAITLTRFARYAGGAVGIEERAGSRVAHQSANGIGGAHEGAIHGHHAGELVESRFVGAVAAGERVISPVLAVAVWRRHVRVVRPRHERGSGKHCGAYDHQHLLHAKSFAGVEKSYPLQSRMHSFGWPLGRVDCFCRRMKTHSTRCNACAW